MIGRQNWLAKEIYSIKEWVNYVFDDFYNLEEVTNPKRKWFDKEVTFFKKRPWVSTKEDSIGSNVRKTEWEIVSWIEYWDKIWAYTDKWYIYNFDWSNAYVFLGIKTNQENTTASSGYDINNNTTKIGQTFTVWANEVVMAKITVRLKKTWNPLGLNLWLFAVWDKLNPIAIPTNTISWSSLTWSYVDYDFNFSSTTLSANTQYFFGLSGVSCSATDYISVAINTTSVYAWWNVFTITNWVELSVSTSDLYFKVQCTRPFLYDSTKKSWIITVAYLWGEPIAITTTVSAYSESTREVTTSSSIMNSWYVGQYAYISAWAVAGTRQARQIETSSAANKFTVSVWFSPNLTIWDTITFYRKTISQLRFTQLRKTDDTTKIVAVDREWYVNYRYYPNFNKLLVRDNKIVALSQNKDWVVYSDQLSFERFSLLSTSFGNDTALNIFEYGSYLIVWFARSLWLIRRVDINNIIDSTQTFIYKFQPKIYSAWLYSEDSFRYIWSDLYVYNSNGIWETLELSNTTIDDIKIVPTTITDEIENYLRELPVWDVFIHYISNNIIIVRRDKSNIKETLQFRYNIRMKAWFPYKYKVRKNFLNFLFTINGKEYSCNRNGFVSFEWLKDIDTSEENIECYLCLSWPTKTWDYNWSISTLSRVMVRMWLDGENQMWGKVKITASWLSVWSSTYDMGNIELMQRYNRHLVEKKWLWDSLYWESAFWDSSRVNEEFPEEFIEVFNFNASYQRIKIEIKNDTDKSICFWDIKTIFLPQEEEIAWRAWIAPSWEVF